MLNTIEFYKEATSSCEHANQTTTETPAECETAGSTVVTCDDCGETISTETIPATGHLNTTTVTTPAGCESLGSTVITCDDCGKTVSTEEIPATGHDISAAYERNGNEHTQTGTCSVCGQTTEQTDPCTLSIDSYTTLDTDDRDAQHHAITTTCEVCEITKTVNEACSFGEGILDDTTLTYTCEHCEYSYTEELTGYTVTFIVPDGVPAVENQIVADGYSIELPVAGTIEGYTFIGWMEAEYTQNTTKPDYFEVGEDYTTTEDVTLYALYSFTEGDAEETWKLATSINSLAIDKEIVIVASGSANALGKTQNSNNRASVTVEKSGDKSTITMNSNIQIITLKAGAADGTWAFHVSGGSGTNAANGYLFAPANGNYLRTQTSINNNASWNISVTSAGIATIKANVTSGQNWLRKNSTSNLFSCYTSGQNDVSIYVKEGGLTTYYSTDIGVECTHTNTTVETTAATCTDTGIERIVCECGHIVSEEEIPALGHNYVDNFCSRCEEQDPATIDYSGYYHISFTHKESVYYINHSELNNNRYYATTDTPKGTDYIYRLVKTAVGIYSLYEFDGDCYQTDITVEKIEDIYRFYATTADGDCQFLLNAGSTTKYVKFYKASNATQSNYAQDITLTPLDLSAHIDGASITLGSDITMNYNVTMSEEFAEAKMFFTISVETVDETVNETVDVEGELQQDGRYKFSLPIPPQFMAANICAELKLGDLVIASMSEYSVKTYAQNKLSATDSSDELKQLITDLLFYGDAAYNYVNKTSGQTPVTDGVENLGTASEATPEETDFTLTKNTEISSYPAYFTGASVYFDSVNKLCIKINTTENVTLKINDEDVAVTGTIVYVEDITPLKFNETYTFVLYCDGVEMQRLTYSVNAYAYAMKENDTMGTLALALYRYGVSVEKYVNPINA